MSAKAVSIGAVSKAKTTVSKSAVVSAVVVGIGLSLGLGLSLGAPLAIEMSAKAVSVGAVSQAVAPEAVASVAPVVVGIGRSLGFCLWGSGGTAHQGKSKDLGMVGITRWKKNRKTEAFVSQ